MKIENKVIDLLQKELPSVVLDISSNNCNTLGWDSQFQLIIILLIEDSFDVTIPNNRLNELTSIKSISKLIEDLSF